MPKESNFDFVSPYYDWLVRVVFGKSMIRAQMVFLERIPQRSSVLVLGGGTGLWLNELLRLNSKCKIVFIDSSMKMIDHAKRITNNSGQIDFRLGNENSVNRSDRFDVVIAYCYLDLFTNSSLTDMISKMRKSTAKGCQWVVVDFVSRSWWHTVMLGIMYGFFRVTTGLTTGKLPEWEPILKYGNIVLVEERLFYSEFIKSAVFMDDGN
ncbi:hypothetical protein BH09BAC3_BH09BAC3_02450 [soil metagenome]